MPGGTLTATLCVAIQLRALCCERRVRLLCQGVKSNVVKPNHELRRCEAHAQEGEHRHRVFVSTEVVNTKKPAAAGGNRPRRRYVDNTSMPQQRYHLYATALDTGCCSASGHNWGANTGRTRIVEEVSSDYLYILSYRVAAKGKQFQLRARQRQRQTVSLFCLSVGQQPHAGRSLRAQARRARAHRARP